MISEITDRMPLLLEVDDYIALWLGEGRTPIEEVVSLIRTHQFCSDWQMDIGDQSKKPPRPKKR